MQKESNFLNPYEVVTDDQERYWFLAESGICYNAAFVKSHGYFYHYPQFDHQVVSFSFKPYGEDQLPFKDIPSEGYSSQTRVRDTIIWLLLESFRLHPEISIILFANPATNLPRAGNGYSIDGSDKQAGLCRIVSPNTTPTSPVKATAQSLSVIIIHTTI